MLGLEYQYTVATLMFGPEPCSAKYGNIVGFGRAGGEDNLPRFRTDSPRDLLPCRFNPVSSSQTPLMFNRGWITETFCPQRLHDFCNLR